MSGRELRAGWKPWAGREPLDAIAQPHRIVTPATITQAIEALTDRVVAVRVLKEQGIMSDTENQQPAAAVVTVAGAAPSPSTPLPPPPTLTAAATPVARAAPAGGFAASIRAMMDEARQGVQQARADGLAEVQDAVGKLADAKQATAKVAGQMAQTIRDEAADVLAELGQISNDL